MVKMDRTAANRKTWNDYRIKTATPTGWKPILDYEQTCTANTVGMAIIDYTPMKAFYGWLDATFPTEYAGTNYDVYVCSKD